MRLAAVATLVLILLNPSDVTQTPGPVDRPDIFYLLDSSQSMAIGDKETRFEQALRLIRDAEMTVADVPHANRKLFRFGHRLTAVEDVSGLGLHSEQADVGPADTRQGVQSASHPFSISSTVSAADSATNRTAGAAGKVANSSSKPLGPTDSDTQLLGALRQVSSRFGRRPPAGLVVFSDGRTRDEAGVDQLSAQFTDLKVPIHVVPLGDASLGGDVAIVACVVPRRARRYSEVDVQVFLRSYGYDGRRCEVSLTAEGTGDADPDRSLAAPVPVTLHNGFQSIGMSFRTEAKALKVKVAATTLPDEVSTTNNAFKTDVLIDRTKIRVLYIEGSSQPLQPIQRGDRYEVRGPYSDLQQALSEDEDIECVVLHAPYGKRTLSRVSQGATTGRGFPETLAELSAFDAIILSDVGADSFTKTQLEWLERWIGQRGGGILMVGGQRSFSAGNWGDTPMAAMLPIEMKSEPDWLPGTQVKVIPEEQAALHPVWSIVSDQQLNRDILGKFPAFFGANRWAGIKPNLTRSLATSNLAVAEAPVVASAQAAPSKPANYLKALQRNMTGKNRPSAPAKDEGMSPTARKDSSSTAEANSQPAIVVGQYGRGRTMAMAVPITTPWASDFLLKWGREDSRYYGKFWRNTVYWLTESSSIGRRRLVVNVDKKFYRPGEAITLSASAFDEGANQTGAYTITGMIEPQASLNDIESDYSPIRWPDGKPRASGETGPFVTWGEEFDLPRTDSSTGKPAFSIELPIADALTVGSASHSLRFELTAMEQSTQVDSTSLDVHILHDPFEQQNPFPNHDLLERIAKKTGGQVITAASQLDSVLRDVPIKAGLPIIKKSSLWSTWWLWSWLLGLLTAEWIWRRVVGLA